MAPVTNVIVEAVEKKQEVVQQVIAQNQVLTSGTHELITITELFRHLLLNPYTILILVFCMLLGATMKRSEKVPNWLIFMTVPNFGWLLGLLVLIPLANFHYAVAFMIGFMAGLAAVGSHIALKQMMEMPGVGPWFVAFPPTRILIALVDEDLLKPARTRIVEKQTKLQMMNPKKEE